ncbi:MAG: hypothetical protein FD180_1122 [Planctomycetota bacterium]|nr:MAG: hypothetical protein FD180_1122 [Planctomycetota bacterium]
MGGRKRNYRGSAIPSSDGAHRFGARLLEHDPLPHIRRQLPLAGTRHRLILAV